LSEATEPALTLLLITIKAHFFISTAIEHSGP